MTALTVDDCKNEKNLNFLNASSAPYPNGNGAPHSNGHTNGHGANGAHNHSADENILIRRYRPEDRAAIRQICCDTGFLGKPIDAIFSDREIFADLFVNPYLDHSPEWAWVADDEGQVAGYLLGSVSPSFNRVLLYSGFQTTMRMIGRTLMGCYARHPRTRHFIRWLLTSGYREQPKHPDNAAHLHFNVEKSHRGHGLGLRLWQAYEEQLVNAGIQNCYGSFFSWPRRRPEAVYSRMGFSVFDRKPTTMFQPEISEPVEIVCVHGKVAA